MGPPRIWRFYLTKATTRARLCPAATTFAARYSITDYRCRPWRYLAVAAWCAAMLVENSCVPDPSGRSTKYSALDSAGSSTALIDAKPGLAMGPGGSPEWR